VDAVPDIWLATYDHDLAEVNHVSIPARTACGARSQLPATVSPGAPVSEVWLGEEILPIVEEAASLLGESETTQLLRESYRPGKTLGTAFAHFYAHLFAAWGVIVLDASDPELHRIAGPIYRRRIEQVSEIDDALLARGQALEAAGYHQQVKVTASSVLLFTLQNGARTPIQRRANGNSAEFVIAGETATDKLSSAELIDRIATTPENFSPSVLLRPVVQDYLLPTLAYAGGAAEAAYFAQAGAVYEKVLGRVTPIVPRFSATVVEPKVQRGLGKYGSRCSIHSKVPEALRHTLAARTLPADLQTAFERANKAVDESFARLNEALTKLDPTPRRGQPDGVSKVHYQLDRLRERAMAG